MVVNGIRVHALGMYGEDEIKAYIKRVEKQVDGALTELTIEPEGADSVRLTYTCVARKFERIRRITGYLSGTLDTWNNSKRAEERERVKHG